MRRAGRTQNPIQTTRRALRLVNDFPDSPRAERIPWQAGRDGYLEKDLDTPRVSQSPDVQPKTDRAVGNPETSNDCPFPYRWGVVDPG